jgi:transcriptional regulator with XRE-family HTH domain
MENYGLIIQHLRLLAGVSVRETARKIDRSIGWLSEIENGCGTARLTEKEFNRIVEVLDGTRHRPMFRTWVANFKNRERLDKTFDGAVLKYIRTKKELTVKAAAQRVGISPSHLSKIELGAKVVSLELRNRILVIYGYSPSSWKNLATDPVRSKAVPLAFKLRILLSSLQDYQTEKVFHFVQSLLAGRSNAESVGGHRKFTAQEAEDLRDVVDHRSYGK